MKVRIQKIIAESGVCSRRRAEDLIQHGRVTVNDKPIKLGDKADPERDIIKVDGIQLQYEKRIYIALNKPRGYLSAVSDPFKRTVLQLLPFEQRLYPIGRLDYDSCGLLLLTNDGNFANRIMHPRYEIEKSYVARLDKKISDGDIKLLNKGVCLDDGFVNCRAKLVNKDTVELTLHEGRNKIVKRIFKRLGYYVTFLQRTKIGFVKLGSLPEGKFRYLTKEEIDSFR